MCGGRLTIQAAFHARGGSEHRADATLELALAEWLHSKTHTISQQWVWLMDVHVCLGRVDDARVYGICEDVGVLGGQVTR